PSLLLLDEPLSNLDAKLREKMRFELKRMQRELGITFIYVTHDQSEALGLSHRIAVMNGGRIVQIGSPKDIYDRPGDNFVAEFVGSTNFISGQIGAPTASPDGYTIQTAEGPLAIASALSLTLGDAAIISVRPEHVLVSLDRPQGPNVWPATVEAQVFLGFCQDLELRCGGLRLEARASVSLDLSAGQFVYVRIDPERCVICK
ncbi:MAG: ABC transporter ATP-binding protein, partial [Stellaceae bacterium]